MSFWVWMAVGLLYIIALSIIVAYITGALLDAFTAAMLRVLLAVLIGISYVWIFPPPIS